MTIIRMTIQYFMEGVLSGKLKYPFGLLTGSGEVADARRKDRERAWRLRQGIRIWSELKKQNCVFWVSAGSGRVQESIVCTEFFMKWCPAPVPPVPEGDGAAMAPLSGYGKSHVMARKDPIQAGEKPQRVPDIPVRFCFAE
jgi:hypothetical protein